MTFGVLDELLRQIHEIPELTRPSAERSWSVEVHGGEMPYVVLKVFDFRTNQIFDFRWTFYELSHVLGTQDPDAILRLTYEEGLRQVVRALEPNADYGLTAIERTALEHVEVKYGGCHHSFTSCPSWSREPCPYKDPYENAIRKLEALTDGE